MCRIDALVVMERRGIFQVLRSSYLTGLYYMNMQPSLGGRDVSDTSEGLVIGMAGGRLSHAPTLLDDFFPLIGV
jgi:hypothetical protein